MKAIPFVIQDESGQPAHSGTIANAIEPGFWMVLFDSPAPGKPGYGKVVPTAELQRFTLFRNAEERALFFAPPVDISPTAPAESPIVPEGNTKGD